MTKQISGLNPVTTIADADVFHVNIDGSNLDRKLTKASLRQQLIDANIANNTQAIAGADDTVIMSPAKTDLYIDERVATVAEAQDDTNDVNLLTPSKAKTLADASPNLSTTQPVYITGGGNLSLYRNYIIGDSLVYTLPVVTGYTGDELLRIIRIQGVEPEVTVDGTESELCDINGTFTDSGFIFDMNTEVIPVFNIATNRWEI